MAHLFGAARLGRDAEIRTVGGDAAVAADRERLKAALMALHEQNRNRHNFYHLAAVNLFGA